MSEIPGYDVLRPFLILVFPGLVSMHVYALLMPSRRIEWTHAVIQGLFYSCVNAVLLLPLVAALLRGGALDKAWYWPTAVLVVIVGPVLWPLLLRWGFRRRWLASRIQIPYPTPWDFFFDLRQPAFLLIHLNSGALVGGYWGPRSYAGSFPNDGDIYLEAVYRVDDSGAFGAPISDTRGLLIRRDEYSYVELFAVPNEERGSHVQ